MQHFCKYLIVLLATISFCHAANSTAEDTIIRSVLQAANEQLLSKSLRFELLKDSPHLVPVLVQWQYDDWVSYDASLTKERLYHEFVRQLDAEDLAFTLVAIRDEVPIGSISLDNEGEPELSDLPGPWPGNFHVIEQERGKGIGKQLGNVMLTIAKELGYTHLYFFTSNPLNVKKYVKKGASVFEMRPFRGHTITVMKMDISSKPR